MSRGRAQSTPGGTSAAVDHSAAQRNRYASVACTIDAMDEQAIITQFTEAMTEVDEASKPMADGKPLETTENGQITVRSPRSLRASSGLDPNGRCPSLH